eukprot:SAG31_NODE_2436_length_5700_cov_13.780396_2_plen_52_part_00
MLGVVSKAPSCPIFYNSALSHVCVHTYGLSTFVVLALLLNIVLHHINYGAM